jgi:ankyrin repeat protein
MSLTEAIEAGDADEVARLLESGADPNVRTRWGGTALIAAVQEGSLEVVELLLAHGADVRAHDEEGSTVLHVGTPKLEILRRLLDAAAAVDAQDADGYTALYLSVAEPELVKELLDHGADPNLATRRFETPLTFCAAWGHAESAALLLNAGANANYVDDETHLSVLCYAAESGHADVAEVLLDHGANPDHRTPEGQSALSLALRHEHLDAALALAERCSAETRRAAAACTATLHEKVQRLMRTINR